MKTICAFLACVLAVTVAEKAGEDIAVAKEISECKKELGLTELTSLEIAESFENASNSEKLSCMLYCVFKKHGMMNENATFNKEALLSRTLASKKELVEKAMENCEKTTKPNDGCKLAACLVNAVSKMAGSPNSKHEQAIKFLI